MSQPKETKAEQKLSIRDKAFNRLIGDLEVLKPRLIKAVDEYNAVAEAADKLCSAVDLYPAYGLVKR